MKKQFFLLSLLLASVKVLPTCETACATTCSTDTEKKCSGGRCDVSDHGHTFRSVRPEFQSASPEHASLFNSFAVTDLQENDKNGRLQVSVFGGKNTKGSASAAYYLPYGHTTLTFDGSVTTQPFASNAAESVVQANAAVAFAANAVPQVYFGGEGAVDSTAGTFDSTPNFSISTDPVTYEFDVNTDTSKILPWNFGITFAALFEPLGAAATGTGGVDDYVGSGLITNPGFKSTVSPTYRRWHVGAGLSLRYHFSDEPNGWYGKVSTAVQHVRSKICLNENVSTEKLKLDTDLATANITGTAVVTSVQTATAQGLNTVSVAGGAQSTVTPVGSLRDAYLNSGFPTDNPDDTTDATPAPSNVTEAFAQNAWNYGKICGEQRITRLADIELSIGKLWVCNDSASTSFEVGVVAPAGNKPSAVNVAPAVVGNNQHAGLRLGSTASFMVSDGDDYKTWLRFDCDTRYLFRNTQKRSFDLLGNEWSRYMMVWKNKEAYTTALAAANTITTSGASATAPGVVGTGTAQRTYTPGINVFTTDMYVRPQFQCRLNKALVVSGEKFRAELGWNVSARQKECLELASAWDNAPAFADSSYVGGVGLNNNRKIYNDSQTTAYNTVSSLTRTVWDQQDPVPNPMPAVNTAAPVFLATLGDNTLQDSGYDNFTIKEAQIDLNSAGTPASVTNTPYLVLGYAFDCDCKPQFSVGGSYEFSAGNAALNQWLVWGKFEVAF